MVPSFKLGFFSFPFRYKDEKGQMAGLAAPLFTKLYYFIFDVFNITLVEFRRQDIDCATNECPFLIDHLQSDVDFIAGLTSLSRLPANITTAPPLNEYQCFLLTTPEIRDRTEFHDIISIFSEFDVWTVIILAFVIIILFILMTNNRDLRIIDTFWVTTMILLRNQTSISKKTTKMNTFIMVLIAGIIYLVFTSSIKTNMVKKGDFLKINCLQMLIERNFSIAFAEEDCQFLASQIQDIDLRRKLLSKQSDLYASSDVMGTVKNFNKTRPRGSLIGKREAFNLLFYFSCSSVGNQIISRKETFMSSKPVMSSIGLNFLSATLHQESRKIFQRGAYGSFEMKLGQEVTSPRFVGNLIGGTKLSCAEETLATEQIFFTSLRTQFFTSIKTLFVLSLPLSVVIFFAEMRLKLFKTLIVC